MDENEVIIVNGIPKPDYDGIINKSIEYGILSIPFTFNRMEIDAILQKIINIAKGKIAEGLLEYFLGKNSIAVDFSICTTPFYQIDKRDFVCGDTEWDLKNNFIYHKGDIYTHNYTDLPALIPNKDEKDQWSKRDNLLVLKEGKTSYLFSFLKNLDEYKGNNNFIDITLTDFQSALLMKKYEIYNGKAQVRAPYTESDFLSEFYKEGVKLNCSVKSYPYLIICAYADFNHWSQFKDSGEKLNFYGKKAFVTKINNSACDIKALPSFLSLHPNLKSNIQCGIIR